MHHKPHFEKHRYMRWCSIQMERVFSITTKIGLHILYIRVYAYMQGFVCDLSSAGSFPGLLLNVLYKNNLKGSPVKDGWMFLVLFWKQTIKLFCKNWDWNLGDSSAELLLHIIGWKRQRSLYLSQILLLVTNTSESLFFTLCRVVGSWGKSQGQVWYSAFWRACSRLHRGNLAVRQFKPQWSFCWFQPPLSERWMDK